jgi:predicted AlkP superfamily pyrophosphatase or phosphodiesterase
VKANRLIQVGVAVGVTLASLTCATASEVGTGDIKHVLLLSIDGMHAVDFYNCSHGIAGVNDGNPYCPTMQALSDHAINYVAAVSSKPSDSFPGLAAIISGGSPKSTGLYYDVAYDRSLDAPAATTGTGLAAGSCTPYGKPTIRASTSTILS